MKVGLHKRNFYPSMKWLRSFSSKKKMYYVYETFSTTDVFPKFLVKRLRINRKYKALRAGNIHGIFADDYFKLR